MSISGFADSIDTYARGKTWYWYLTLWLLGLYTFYELFQFNMVEEKMPFVLLIPYSFDFVMHEFAHIFTVFLPPVLTASAGSGSELLLGTILVVMAFWQRSYFASLFSALWFALAAQSAGQYMADAVPQQLQLVSLGGALSGQDPKHDWHFVFGQLGLLPESSFIGNTLRFFGMLIALSALTFTAWLIYKMAHPAIDNPIQEQGQPKPSLPIQDDGVFTPRPKRNESHESPDDTPPPGAHDSFS